MWDSLFGVTEIARGLGGFPLNNGALSSESGDVDFQDPAFVGYLWFTMIYYVFFFLIWGLLWLTMVYYGYLWFT